MQGVCRKEWIEEIVINQIKRIIFDDELIETIADRAIEALNTESSILPSLRKQYAEIQRGIDNMLNAIQQGIITSSTKERPEKLEHRRRLIDSFINSIYLYDDKMVITFNYKDGSKTITMEEIENSAISSDLTSLAAPKESTRSGAFSLGIKQVTGLERRKQKKVLRDLFPAVGFSPILSFAPISQARTKLSEDDGMLPDRNDL